jgi:hypothetical protein
VHRGAAFSAPLYLSGAISAAALSQRRRSLSGANSAALSRWRRYLGGGIVSATALSRGPRRWRYVGGGPISAAPSRRRYRDSAAALSRRWRCVSAAALSSASLRRSLGGSAITPWRHARSPAQWPNLGGTFSALPRLGGTREGSRAMANESGGAEITLTRLTLTLTLTLILTLAL